ncbi:hypothetical protein D1818_01990 [Aquimarina sp. BL5]|uniref:hypothetical protein n=1 Tax=Aquimarina sp. BL5 TaxID=1714860 RepID=UPI000E4F0E53|nr:hypothetical protein [Aquimarina sp. BL5]AXT49649.1 hypothetical protein D1818_01990 [Aquimarina sp. BL5]RKN00872.1 hypothetical protein D7036_18220 [Aquimarina sp. BL5]
MKNIFNKTEVIKWKTDESILSFLKNNIDTNGNLGTNAFTLPGDKKIDNKLPFSTFGPFDNPKPGKKDLKKLKKRIGKLTKLLKKISKTGDIKSESEFYKEITETKYITEIIDEFLYKLTQLKIPIEDHLFNFAHNLATKTDNKNSVKFGIAILIICEKKKPVEDLKILGLHEEFTVLSSLAISYLSDNVISDLWELAKKVDGYGKINLVEYMAKMDMSDEIRDWLVYEGYKNNMLYEHSAYTCIINGRLSEKLSKSSIDNELFISAGKLIPVVMYEEPEEQLNPVSLLKDYLKHSKEQQLKISDFNFINTIKSYFEDLLSEIQDVNIQNWEENDLSNCLIDIDEILISKDWNFDIQKAFKSSDKEEYNSAVEAAKKMRINILDILWDKLISHPFDSVTWSNIIANANPEDATRIIEQAIKHLPLEEISTGPKNCSIPDTKLIYEKHLSLQYLITFLENYPKEGHEIIIAGLRNPMSENRYRTIETLEKWTSSNWTQEIENELLKLKKIEPNSYVKKNLKKLILNKVIQ